MPDTITTTNTETTPNSKGGSGKLLDRLQVIGGKEMEAAKAAETTADQSKPKPNRKLARENKAKLKEDAEPKQLTDAEIAAREKQRKQDDERDLPAFKDEAVKKGMPREIAEQLEFPRIEDKTDDLWPQFRIWVGPKELRKIPRCTLSNPARFFPSNSCTSRRSPRARCRWFL